MDKLIEKKPKKARAKDDGELTINDETSSDEDELDDNAKLQLVIDSIWDKYDTDNSGSLDMDQSRTCV